MAASSPRPRFLTKSSIKGPRAMEVLDEAVSLIRQAPLAVLSIYYLGALPFCLGVIYFWFDMTQGADAEVHLASEALALTGLYLWMKTCQAVFARKLLAVLEGEDAEPWTLQRVAHTAVIQVVYAGTFILIYPLSIIATIPFAWTNAFYHNISIVGTGSKSTLRTSLREATDLARLWPKQNHLIIGIVFVAWFVLFLNIAVFCMAVPELLNSLLGIETVFDENAFAWNNSSFYLDVCTFCFLILNPVNKAVYVLRCFYGRARINGADLKSALRRYEMTRSTQPPVRALAVITLFLFVTPGSFVQADTPATKAASSEISIPDNSSSAKLDRAIQKTLQKDEFSWRMPRVAETDVHEGWLVRTVDSVMKFFRHVMHEPLKWLEEFLKWLFKYEPKHDLSSSSWWRSFSQIPWRLIIVLFALAVVLTLLYWLFLYNRRKPRQTLNPVSTTPIRSVDLEAEDVRADDLPEDSWLALAQQMIERGELRLALRALYLATLSVLAQKELVRLGAAKSNRDYLLEMTRRLRGNTTLPVFFKENIGLFEASWYGTHAVTLTMIETMRVNQQQMRSHATA